LISYAVCAPYEIFICIYKKKLRVPNASTIKQIILVLPSLPSIRKVETQIEESGYKKAEGGRMSRRGQHTAGTRKLKTTLRRKEDSD
jgi:hypothetical protein